MDLSDPIQRDFGDYELLEKIGQGGMGGVYRARQHSLDREVALKLLAAGPWASSDFVLRFQREAQSAARLEHPNIVTVYDSGSQHDLHYFSMRLVRGESLAARLARDGPIPARDAARLLRVIADALDYAHRLGVLHLDLKPGNVLIDETGEPLVADFGMARRIDQAFAEDGDDVSGTPSYMAPEQATAHSQRIGRGTDIYGLGSILYELLTGRPPFLSATPQATLESVVRDPVREPIELVPGLAPDLNAICLACLQKAQFPDSAMA
jgi:serine/threonine protein kinase